MTRKILFSATPTEKRAALLENERVVELVVERPDRFRLVGNIYRGRVQSIVPGIQAAFVDIGLEKAAFLHVSDVDPSVLLDSDDDQISPFDERTKRKRAARVPIERVLEQGQQILVQVAKEPIGTKGTKVTTQISLAGRFLVLVLDTDFIGVSKKSSDARKRARLKKLISQIKPPGIGFIVRTIGLNVSEPEFVREIHSLLDTWKKIQDEALAGSGPKLVHKEQGITIQVIRDLLSDDVAQVYVDQKEDYQEILAYLKTVSPHLCERVVYYEAREPLFDKFNVEKELEKSLRRKVWLRSGGYIIFDHAEALLAIDVNTGRNIGKRDLEETILQTNLEAATEIGRQLRLRDIGGLIVVDFIDMQKPENRNRLEEEMRRVLGRDSSSSALTGLSKFGLMEITRKRVRPELQELYTEVCPACNGLGWVFSPATITTRIDRWLRRAGTGDISRKLSIAVHPAVAAYLRKENSQMIKNLEREHNFELNVVEDEDLDQDEYEFYPMGENRPITSRHQ